eukprot:TRINITY_DN4024_c0_g3_i1.p1 TRINITY_DN4024_c0_g3~~TRINITY_DN4024_c0_g3_i1.p1  ORF type:complete len:409 (-),score=59.04 TRINITY_DN4024_c0_g3_i1:267-1457(-)
MTIKTLVSVLLTSSARAELPLNPGGLVGCRCLNPVELGAILNVTGDRVLFHNPKGSVAEVSTTFGSTCDTWDQKADMMYDSACAEKDAPPRCSNRWCYVDACSCNQPDVESIGYFNVDQTHYFKLGFSVRTCSETTLTDSSDEYLIKRCSSKNEPECKDDVACKYVSSSCSPATTSERLERLRCRGKSGCPCINPAELNCVAQKDGTVTFNKAPTNACIVPSNYASACSAWDSTPGMQFYNNCSSSNPATWCSKAWCYVDMCNCDDPEMGPSEYFKVDGALKLGYSYKTCDSDGRGTSSYLTDKCNEAGAEGEDACKASSLCEVSSSSNPNITNCTPRALQLIQEENIRQCAGSSGTQRCTNSPPKPDPCRDPETSAAGQNAAGFLIVSGIVAALA